MADESSDNSSFSDSDDEFLTSTKAGGTDREALVRKKLLENFYGKAAVASDDTGGPSAHTSVDDEDDGPGQQQNERSSSRDDLDSKDFDAVRHAENQMRSSSVHDLLETEERLALEVRTLDSTMQTLVYENYSRFIDATDAIRSIGVNVQANELGLRQLTESMSRVNDASRTVEDSLGTLRFQVAEKIRVKRLLTRLDTLLKLPVTLRGQIAAGKYRTAAQSYLSAASILAKHSQGFESLKSIETQCTTILTELKIELKQKLLHWSGRWTGMETNDSINTNKIIRGESDDADMSYNSSGASSIGDDDDNAPKPPKSMTEVFECAGTLYLLEQQEQGGVDGSSMSSMAKEEFCSMAVAASMRFLDRLLDSHLIQVQERRFATDSMMLMMDPTGKVPVEKSAKAIYNGGALIPRDYLDAILEGATLYGVSFGAASDGEGTMNTADEINVRERRSDDHLLDFVTEAFASFLSHVRSILLEESVQANRDDSADGTTSTESSHKEISEALSILVQCVREIASGLALPDVGIHPDFAANLVDQAMELTESMVRRRVDQKFYDLRLNVVKDCLIPYAARAVAEREAAIQTKKEALPSIIQVARNALSDCLQLVDDVIRSIFAEGADQSGDLPDLRDAVHISTDRFACWLANAFEILAGGEPTDSKYIADAPLLENGHAPSEDSDSDMDDEESGLSLDGGLDDVLDLMESAYEKLVSASNQNDGTLHADFILGTFELCRMSEASVSENIDQSLAAHLGGAKKKSSGIFPTGTSSPTPADPPVIVDEIKARFQLAASRVLVLYATNCGVEAANILCNDLHSLASKTEDDTETNPSSSVLAVLSVAKRIALECGTIFGGNKRGGPVPKWDPSALTDQSAYVLSRHTGLALDVERMFKERVTIYPHPSQRVELSTSTVLYLFFKIVLRALFESARLYNFTSFGFFQLLIDSMLLKHMVPHYVNKDFNDNGANGCSGLISLIGDVVEVVADQCSDERCEQDDSLKREAWEILGSFLASLEQSSISELFVIQEAS